MPEETFRWIIAAGVAIAALAMVSMATIMISLFRFLVRVQGRIEEFSDRAEPAMDSVRDALNQNGSKVGDILTAAQATALNAREVSEVAKDQAHRFAEIGRDITDRAKVQVARVDAAVDQTVEQVQDLGNDIRSAVMKPAAQASGVIAGLRAGVAAYSNGRRPNVSRATQDEEMFI